MAYFAELNSDNVVLRVIAVNNNELLENGVEIENKGIEFCKSLYGEKTKWVQTSYNNNIRKQYAGIGYVYDINKDKFICPQPFSSWYLDENDDWQSPIPYPITYNLNLKDNDIPVADYYEWNEETLNWVLLDNI